MLPGTGWKSSHSGTYREGIISLGRAFPFQPCGPERCRIRDTPSFCDIIMFSLDTETTGLDFHHGARPYLVMTCGDDGQIDWWEWDVDPLTREPRVPDEDLKEISRRLDVAAGWGVGFDEDMAARHVVVCQNGKFDAMALASIGIGNWPWDQYVDTLTAGHLLASSQPHDLTSMAIHYLGENIQPYEDAMEAAVKECRRIVQQARLKVRRKGDPVPFADWAIAEEGREDMPSARDKTWKIDGWLPRAMARAMGHETDHPWWTVLSAYANKDSETTMALWMVMKEEIKRRSMWNIFKTVSKRNHLAYRLEMRGVTGKVGRLRELQTEFIEESAIAGRRCVSIAASMDYDLHLPRSGANKSLMEFAFEKLRLPVVKRTDGGTPSLSKEAFELYRNDPRIKPGSRQHRFLVNLEEKRKRDTALAYMSGYERFMRIVNHVNGEEDWFVLHPHLNPTGTITLRWSCQNPNEQNISKRGIEMECPGCSGLGCDRCKDEGTVVQNLRYCFGPLPGRVWFSLDGENLELRIPGYGFNEKAMIELFERPKDPPYYGSNHLVIAHILHKDLFEACLGPDGQVDGRIFKDKYKSTWYQWIKNGNFAIACGAVEQSGTADRAYHVPGAQHIIAQHMQNMARGSADLLKFAEKSGYVETMPDRNVDPNRGYPIMCTRTDWGKVLPTTPFSYHVQGTAMWWMTKAQIRCQKRLDDWLAEDGFDGRIVMQVHDELVFDFPGDDLDECIERIQVIKGLMEDGGRDLITDKRYGPERDVPTPVSVEFHPDNWADGIKLKDLIKSRTEPDKKIKGSKPLADGEGHSQWRNEPIDNRPAAGRARGRT